MAAVTVPLAVLARTPLTPACRPVAAPLDLHSSQIRDELRYLIEALKAR